MKKKQFRAELIDSAVSTQQTCYCIKKSLPHPPATFTRKRTPVLNRRIGGPQNRSGPFREVKNILPLSGYELRIARPVA